MMNLTDIEEEESKSLALFPMPRNYKQSNQLIQHLSSNDLHNEFEVIKEQL
jgi:hypothetical protein